MALGLASMLTSCRPSELPAAGPAADAAISAAGQASGPLLTEIRWLAPEADLVAELTTEPAECLTPTADPATAQSIAVGRGAFRSSTLLGGQAARAGLSCASCHSNGRGNAAFFFLGVSGAPGTADVTSSFFSSHRGDGVPNPVPIPDLAGPPERLKVDRTPQTGALETFIRGLIVEEFDGPEPAAATLDGLAAYVRALSPAACLPQERMPITVEGRVADVLAAAEAGAAASAAGDYATADLLLGGARGMLGRINERYAGAEHEGVRAALASISAELASLQTVVRGGTAVSLSQSTFVSSSPLDVRLEALANTLEENEARSLYDRDVLSRALAEQR